MRTPPVQRPQSAAEEIANCVSHAIGFVLAAGALPLLLQGSLARAEPLRHAIAASVFCATLMLLYLSSALYHGLPTGRGKQLFERLDHAAIYLFVAGSYTPFAASSLHGQRAWLTLALVWTLALLGAAVTLSNRPRHPLWSTVLYVALGWLVLLAALPLVGQVSAAGVMLLVAGGLSYTFGAGLFLLGMRLRFAHLAWHLLVMAGSALHAAATLQQV